MSPSATTSITAAILAGGFGTRLRETVPDRPKGLAEVAGRPFLGYVLEQLASSGIDDVVLCTGYMGDRIRSAFGDTFGTLKIRYSRESEPLGTAGAVRLALPLLRSDPVMVMNGDSYFEADLAGFLGWHRERKAAASLLLARVADTGRFGRVVLSGDGGPDVACFDEKGNASGPGLINAGIYLLGPGFLSDLQDVRAGSLERDVFPRWIGRRLMGHEVAGRFIDIGTPESYKSAEAFFQANRCESH